VLWDLNANAGFSYWDEFSHWGTVAKLVAQEHTFHLKAVGVRSYFEDYAPGMALAVYFMCRLAGFSEPAVYFTYAVVLAAALLPMVGLAARASLLRGAIAVVAGFLMVALLGHGWSSALVDHVVGAIFGGVLCVYLLERDRPPRALLAVVPILCFLVLVRDSGSSFALLTGAAIAIDQLLRGWRIRRPDSRLPLAGVLLVIVVAPMAVTFSWKSYVVHAEVQTNFPSASLGRSLTKLRHCCHTERELAVVQAFFQELTGRQHMVPAQASGLLRNVATQLRGSDSAQVPPTTENTSHGRVLGLVLALSLAAVLLAGSRAAAGANAVFVVILLFGFVAYTLVLLTYYLYIFSDYEARVVTSMARYLRTFELAMLLVAAALLLQARTRLVWLNAAVTAVLALFLAYVWSHAPVTRTYLARGSAAILDSRKDLQRYLAPLIAASDRRARVYVLWQSATPADNGFDFWQAHYELRPRNTNLLCFSVGRKLRPDDMYSCPMTPVDLAALLAPYDYVVVANGLSSLEEQYPSIFGRSSGRNRRMFRVEGPAQKLVLQPIHEPTAWESSKY
jgi:hypothetical protein